MLKKLFLRIIFKLFYKFMNNTPSYEALLLERSGYLSEKGWFNTCLQKESIDINGQPIPWIVYPALFFLESKISNDLTVFEYGCGNSTLWWATHASHVVSCEHDEIWFNKTKSRIPPNVELVNLPLLDGLYSKYIKNYNSIFDVIFIDGRDRVNCIKNSLNALKDNGVIIVDNSDRAEYFAGFDFLRESGYKSLDFEGMGPITSNSWRTTIFYKVGNCLGI